MIVDAKGNMFEDRRKSKVDRRKIEGEKDEKDRRRSDRRKAPEQVTKPRFRKKK